MRLELQKIIDDYKIKSIHEYEKLNVPLRKLIKPITHIKMNDPYLINVIDEVPLFFEIFHEGREKETVNNLMNGINGSEFNLLKKILNTLIEFNKFTKNKSLPYSSILRHFYQYKLINKLLPECKSFFEIGPGAGFLPIISVLSNKEINYLCTDISEAYFLTQKIIYKYFGLLNTDLKKTKKGEITHFPWWDYMNLSKIYNKEIDCIIINHAVCEMDENAIRYLLKLSLKINNKYIFIESPGHDEFLSFKKVRSIFNEFNYKITYERNNTFIFKYSNLYSKKIFNYKKILNYPFLRLMYNETEYLMSKINEKLYHNGKSIFEESNNKIDEINVLYDDIYKSSGIKPSLYKFD